MKKLLRLTILALCVVRLDAAVFELDGDLDWEITEPRCTFTLDGDLKNNGPGSSGTIKLVLWATARPFPSQGYIVGETTLGSIASGFQFSDFEVRTVSKLPAITGTYQFTIVVTEFTTAGWRNVLAVPSGAKALKSGNFVSQKKWRLPDAPVVSPAPVLLVGPLHKLSARATGLLNEFPVGSRDRITFQLLSDTKLTLKGPTGKRSGNYKYLNIKSTYNKNKAFASKLVIELGETDTKPKSALSITFFFQGLNSGSYKCVETTSTLEDTTWGVFNFQ